MRRRLVTILAIIGAILFTAGTAFPCSVGRILTGVDIPTQMVSSATLILRVTAVEYATPFFADNGSRTRASSTKIRFKVEEVIKGTYSAKDLVLSGYLNSTDDWNDRSVPYDLVRPAGRHGDCFASTYRMGAQFLLALQKNSNSRPAPFSSDTEYTTDWYALGPVNEQLRSETDPWLVWVREQVARKK